MKELFRKLTDVIFVNFIWLLVSFFGILITLGAATTAMFRVIFQVFKKNEPTSVLSLFIDSFKKNFFISTLVWIFLALSGAALFLMYHYGITHQKTFLVIMAIVGGYQWIIFTIYFFPTVALFETNKKLDLIKNVILIANTNIWTNFKVLGSLAFMILLIVGVHESFILVAVGLYGVLVSFHLKKVFKPYLAKWGENDEEEGLDTWHT